MTAPSGGRTGDHNGLPEPPSITVVGSVNMDLVVSVQRLPLPGETLLGSDYATHPGGKGANQAVAAARLGGQVRFVGRVGSDGFGAELRAALNHDHVATNELRVSAGPSGVAFIQVDERGQNSIVVSPGANFALKVSDITASDFKGADALLLQLEVPLPVVSAAARRAKAAGALVILNLAPAQPLSAAQLSDVSHLLVNENEAGVLLGRSESRVASDPLEAAEELTVLVPQVVITLGAAGSAWAVRGADGAAPISGLQAAFDVKVVDTTGAGDCFAGALAVYLSETRAACNTERTEPVDRNGSVDLAGSVGDLEAAVRFANAAGALATKRPGAQPSLPTREAVERLLSKTPH